MTSRVKRRRSRIIPVILAVAASLALAIPAASAASTRWRARLVAANHAPLTCTRWHIAIRATRGARKLSGRVEYYYVTAANDDAGHLGANRRAGTAANHYGDFSAGVFRDTVVLPSLYAAGVALDFNAVVRTAYGTQTVATVITPRRSRRQCA